MKFDYIFNKLSLNGISFDVPSDNFPQYKLSPLEEMVIIEELNERVKSTKLIFLLLLIIGFIFLSFPIIGIIIFGYLLKILFPKYKEYRANKIVNINNYQFTKGKVLDTWRQINIEEDETTMTDSKLCVVLDNGIELTNLDSLIITNYHLNDEVIIVYKDGKFITLIRRDLTNNCEEINSNE